MRMYATQSDYYEFVGGDEPETELDELTASLRRASGQVESHLRTARYQTDEDGYPTEQHVADALRDATCAYVAYWMETGDITGADAMSGPVKIGSVSLGGTAVGGASSRTPTDTRRSDEAIQILANAGLITAKTAHT